MGDSTPPYLIPPQSLNEPDNILYIIPFKTSKTFAVPIYDYIKKLNWNFLRLFAYQLRIQAHSLTQCCA